MSLTITYSKQAAKYLRKMPAKQAQALVRKINTYASNPEGTYAWVKPLVGIDGFRIRQGNYRAVFSVNNGVATMTVYKIGPRGSIY